MVKEKIRKWEYWNLRVPEKLDKQLENYIEIDSFATKAEFIREAVRTRLILERERMEENRNGKSTTQIT